MDIIKYELIKCLYIIYSMSGCLTDLTEAYHFLGDAFGYDKFKLDSCADLVLNEKYNSYKTIEIYRAVRREIDYLYKRDGINISKEEDVVLAIKGAALRSTEFFYKKNGVYVADNVVVTALIDYANANERYACLTLGYLHLKGDLVEKDINKALYYLDKGAKLGEIASIYLGIKYNEEKRDDYLLSLYSLLDYYSLPKKQNAILLKYNYSQKIVRPEIKTVMNLLNDENKNGISNHVLKIIYSNLSEEEKELLVATNNIPYSLMQMPINNCENIVMNDGEFLKSNNELDNCIKRTIVNQINYSNGYPLLIHSCDSFSIEKKINLIKKWLNSNNIIEIDCFELSARDVAKDCKNMLLKRMAKSPKYPVIILKNIEKTKYELLEDLSYFLKKVNRHKYYLQDVDVNINVENLVLIATTNNIKLVNEQIINAVSPIEITPMNSHDKLLLLQDCLNDSLDGHVVEFSEDFVNIIDKYSFSELFAKVESVICKKINNKKLIRINKEDVEDSIKNHSLMGFR